MNTFLKNSVKWAIDYLQSVYDQQQLKDAKDVPPYSPLSPTSQAKDTSEYCNALDWAISNRKKEDIKNIALTGPYGSGKSSIIKTYIETNTNKDLHFLPISLATFKEEEEEDSLQRNGEDIMVHPEVIENVKNKTEKPGKTDLLRLIELSILQQIFYHEDDKNIPDSRFRKIKSFTKTELRITTGLLMLVAISLTQLLYPTFIDTQLNLQSSNLKSAIMHWIALVSVVMGAAILIYRSIRILSYIKLSKLNFQNAEIKIGENISKSVLNHHLDEILYFFQVTPYNVVIIEDLDRFRQTDVFTKLREINLLINNSSKVKNDVVFVYAVRDDMFKEDNERTKFFDFIIPVIPVINPSNSSQKLLDKKEKYKFDISENLIDSLSMFIDDMRLLHNITNEYYLYYQKLNKSLIQDKLLAMIVYKNLFPNDFTALSHNKGRLYEAITNKQSYIASETIKIKDEIETYKKEIKELENVKIKDTKELRNSYLLYLIDSLPGYISFSIGGNGVPTKKLTEDVHFDTIRKGTVEYISIDYYNNRVTKTKNVDFKIVEDEVDEENNYDKRKQQVDDINNNKINALKKQISKKENDITKLRSLKIRELLEKNNIEIKLHHEKQSRIVNILLRDGFIDEDYLDYITLFYEGSLTKDDYQFLLNIKTRIYTPFDFALKRIDNLIAKINPFDFDKPFVLNYYLIDYIIITPSCSVQMENVFSGLANQSEQSTTFINGYLDNGKNIALFIQQLAKKWPEMWSFIENKSLYDEERKRLYFSLLLEHADIPDLSIMYQNETFKRTLLSKPEFLSIIPDKERLQITIKQLSIKFSNLDKEKSPEDLLDFIYLNSFYKINPQMLRMILSHNKRFLDNTFSAKNYGNIIHSLCTPLIKYISENINDYLTDVYFQIKENKHENEVELIQLLNNENILKENKLKIIEQVETRISDLSKITEVEVKNNLIVKNKIIPTWQNVFDYYQADGSSSIIFLKDFVADLENLHALSANKIPTDKGSEPNSYQPFISKILLFNDLADEVYVKLLKSVPYPYPKLDFGELNLEKVSGLIDSKIISFNTDNFDLLKETKSPLHLALLKTNKAAYMADLSSIKLDAPDLLALLISENFTSTEKNVLTESVEETMIISDSQLLQKIGELVLKDNSFRISQVVLHSVLVAHSLSIEQHISIFVLKNVHFENAFISDFLNAMGEPYSDITINGKRPTLQPIEYNKKLVEVLHSRGYISSYDINEKGIKAVTFSKEQES
jgi:hypothetical protein